MMIDVPVPFDLVSSIFTKERLSHCHHNIGLHIEFSLGPSGSRGFVSPELILRGTGTYGSRVRVLPGDSPSSYSSKYLKPPSTYSCFNMFSGLGL